MGEMGMSALPRVLYTAGMEEDGRGAAAPTSCGRTPLLLG